MDERGRGIDVIEERERVRGRMQIPGAEPTEDPLGFFRGLGIALAVCLPVWVGLVWGVSRLS